MVNPGYNSIMIKILKDKLMREYANNTTIQIHGEFSHVNLPPGHSLALSGTQSFVIVNIDYCLDKTEHSWINVGFHHDKFVCKSCDKEKT